MKKNDADDDHKSSKFTLDNGYHWLKGVLEKQLGFQLRDLSSLSSASKLLHKPCDPSSLAVVRILFGILMVIDIHHERGLSVADLRWGDPNECRFPFFSFLKPLTLEWMCILYLVMLIGAVGMAVGAKYRISCMCFIIPYWFIFLLDKSKWNNHSYLFGLLSLQLALSDANRFWSLDGHWNPEIQNRNVPLWNYTLLRGQVFLVYFIAGLKKTDRDWVCGYSMGNLGLHWVFDGFRFFLEDDYISLFIVHIGGFLLDLSVGFFMIMEATRPAAFIFCAAFNLMNSRMFAIGMFPYVMIAVMPIFCYADWPKTALRYFPVNVRKAILYENPPGTNPRCIYQKKMVPSTEILLSEEVSVDDVVFKSQQNDEVTFYHKLVTVCLCFYFGVQGFLPYSHWITKGYNTWTKGLYGYSWDMMVHNWRYMHTKVIVVDKKTGRQLYLDPEAWTQSWRWTHHADMVKQFALCVQDKFADKYNITEIELYVDIWISLNQRFTQRVYDPTVDIITADWSPFHEVSWVLPLLADLSEWRQRLQEMEEKLFKERKSVDIIFVTDFPGFDLVNYVGEEVQNATLEVLKGEIEVQFPEAGIVILDEGRSLEIPSGYFHKVTPLHHTPASYMYTYAHAPSEESATARPGNYAHDGSSFFTHKGRCGIENPLSSEERQHNNEQKTSLLERWANSFYKKYKIWRRSVKMLAKAIYSIFTRLPMTVERDTIDW